MAMKVFSHLNLPLIALGDIKDILYFLLMYQLMFFLHSVGYLLWYWPLPDLLEAFNTSLLGYTKCQAQSCGTTTKC